MTEPAAGWTPPPAQKSGGGIAKGCLISAGIVVAIGIILLIVAAVAVKDTADKVQRRLQTTTPSGDTVTITADEFAQIERGMTQAQVEAIIGGPGRLLSENQVGQSHTVLLSWGGKELGGNANVTFQNDAVVGKAQFGLNE